jgi:hypothetical protein
MSASAKLLSSQVIKLIKNDGTTVSVEWATQTTAWSRKFCAETVQTEFAAVVEANKSQLPAGTTIVAMKYVDRELKNS